MQRLTGGSPFNNDSKQGDEYFKKGEYEKAIRYYDQVLATCCSEADYCNRAKAYYNLGEYDNALTSLDPASFTAGHEIEYIKAEICLQEKKYADAVYHYNMIINWRSDSLPDRLLVSNCHHGLGNVHYAENKYQLAIDAFNECLKHDDLNSSAYESRGLAYLHLKQYDQAISDFTRALKIHPHNVKRHVHLGDAYEAKGDHANAIYHYGLSCHDNDEFIVNKINKLYAKKKIVSLFLGWPKEKEMALLKMMLAIIESEQKKLLEPNLLAQTKEVQDRLNFLQKEVTESIKKISDDGKDINLDIEEALFNTMSVYRLKKVELRALEPKRQDELAAQKYRVEEKSNEKTGLEGWEHLLNLQVEKKSNETGLGGWERFLNLQDKIDEITDLLFILHDLKTKRRISEKDIEKLRKFKIYDSLVKKLEEVDSTVISRPYSETVHDRMVLSQLEKDFISRAKQKISDSNNRYQFIKTLNQVGLLREDVLVTAASFSSIDVSFFPKPAYRGDLMEHLSYSKLKRDPTTINHYTSQFKIREKVDCLFSNRGNSPDQFSSQKAKVEQAKKDLEMAKSRLISARQNLQEKKKEASSSPEVTAYRKQLGR